MKLAAMLALATQHSKLKLLDRAEPKLPVEEIHSLSEHCEDEEDEDAARVPPLKCTPALAFNDFSTQVMGILRQLQAHKASFVAELDAEHLVSFGKIFQKVPLSDGQIWAREGEEAETLALLLYGELSLDEFSGPSGRLHPGQIIGDMELCQASNGSNIRAATVSSVGDSMLAEVKFEEFSRFVEGLGPKLARSFSKHLADSVLQRVKQNDDRAEKMDRHRLKNIGTRRRFAFSAPCQVVEDDLAAALERVESGTIGRTTSSSQEPREDRLSHSIAKLANQTHRKADVESHLRVLEKPFDKLRLLSTMDKELATKIKFGFHVVQFKEGDIIHSGGEALEAFYIQISGEMGVYAPDKEEKEVALGFSRPTSAMSTQSEVSGPEFPTANLSSVVSGKGKDEQNPINAVMSPKMHALDSPVAKGNYSPDSVRPHRKRQGNSPNARRKVSPHAEEGHGSLMSWLPNGKTESKMESPMQTRSMMIDFGSPISRANGGLQYRSPADMTTTNLKSVAASNAGKVDMSNTLKASSVADAFKSAAGVKPPNKPPSPTISFGKANPVHIYVPSVLKPIPSLRQLWGEHKALFPVRKKVKKKREGAGGVSRLLLNMRMRGDAHGWFGECGLLTPLPTEFTYCAGTDVTCLAISHHQFNQIRLQHEQAQASLLGSLVEAQPFARLMTSMTICNLVDASTIVNYKDGEEISSETVGASDECYIVVKGKAGQIKATRLEGVGVSTHLLKGEWEKAGMKVVKELDVGHMFAEHALEEPRPDMDFQKLRLTPTIIALGPCSCLTISRQVFKNVAGPYEQYLHQLRTMRRTSVASARGSSRGSMTSISRAASQNLLDVNATASRRGSTVSRRSSNSRRDSFDSPQGSPNRTRGGADAQERTYGSTSPVKTQRRRSIEDHPRPGPISEDDIATSFASYNPIDRFGSTNKTKEVSPGKATRTKSNPTGKYVSSRAKKGAALQAEPIAGRRAKGQSVTERHTSSEDDFASGAPARTKSTDTRAAKQRFLSDDSPRAGASHHLHRRGRGEDTLTVASRRGQLDAGISLGVTHVLGGVVSEVCASIEVAAEETANADEKKRLVAVKAVLGGVVANVAWQVGAQWAVGAASASEDEGEGMAIGSRGSAMPGEGHRMYTPGGSLLARPQSQHDLPRFKSPGGNMLSGPRSPQVMSLGPETNPELVSKLFMRLEEEEDRAQRDRSDILEMPSEGSEDEEEDEDYGRTPDLCSPVRGKKAGRGGRDGVELGAHSHGGKFAKTGGKTKLPEVKGSRRSKSVDLLNQTVRMGESPAGKGPVWLPAERVKGFAGREHMEVPSKKRRGVVATKGALSDSPYAPSPTRHPLDPTSMSPALPQGGKISTANVKSALDWELYRTYGLPGPGSYECTGKVMGSIDREPGITLSKGKRQSTLDTVMRLAGRLPGDVLCIPAPLAYLVSRFYSEQAYPGRSASRDGRATARVQRL